MCPEKHFRTPRGTVLPAPGRAGRERGRGRERAFLLIASGVNR